MAGLIKATNTVEEGQIFNRWLYNRLIANNKNVLSATTGPTGSGKSYQDLRRAEIWYQYYFKEPFPEQNICFSVAEAMKLISSGKLRRGEIVIFEEAGANLGSLDFQNKVVKLFTYVLQVFRSLNIAVFFNLPYLSMLTKTARMLIHVQFETCGINHKEKVAKSKGFFLQVNQSTGKVYKKYLRVKHNGKTQTIKRFNYLMPSKELVKAYEDKKFKFVSEMTTEFSEELAKIEKGKLDKLQRPTLTEKQRRVYELYCKGLTLKQIAEIEGNATSTVHEVLTAAKKKGFRVEKRVNSKESREIRGETPTIPVLI